MNTETFHGRTIVTHANGVVQVFCNGLVSRWNSVDEAKQAIRWAIFEEAKEVSPFFQNS